MKTYQISPMNEAEAELLASIEQALTNFRVTTGKVVRSIKVIGHNQYGTEIAIRADVSDNAISTRRTLAVLKARKS